MQYNKKVTREFEITDVLQQPQHYERAMNFIAGLSNLQETGHDVHLCFQDYTQKRMHQKNPFIADQAERESASSTEILVIAKSDNQHDLREFAERLDNYARFCQAKYANGSSDLITEYSRCDIAIYGFSNFFVFFDPEIILPQKHPLN